MIICITQDTERQFCLFFHCYFSQKGTKGSLSLVQARREFLKAFGSFLGVARMVALVHQIKSIWHYTSARDRRASISLSLRM